MARVRGGDGTGSELRLELLPGWEGRLAGRWRRESAPEVIADFALGAVGEEVAEVGLVGGCGGEHRSEVRLVGTDVQGSAREGRSVSIDPRPISTNSAAKLPVGNPGTGHSHPGCP